MSPRNHRRASFRFDKKGATSEERAGHKGRLSHIAGALHFGRTSGAVMYVPRSEEVGKFVDAVEIQDVLPKEFANTLPKEERPSSGWANCCDPAGPARWVRFRLPAGSDLVCHSHTYYVLFFVKLSTRRVRSPDHSESGRILHGADGP